MHRSRLLMIGGLALAVGLLVSYTVYNRLRLFPGQGSERGVQLLVAANDIQLGTKLRIEDVRSVTVPQSAAPPNAYVTPQQVLGRGAILPISKGEFLLPGKLAALNAGAGLPSMIPPGMRAVSVRVNDVVSVAGFVQPGTRVDVLSTGARGGGNDRQTTTVLENVAVIAVGKNLDRNSDTQAAEHDHSSRISGRRAKTCPRFSRRAYPTLFKKSSRYQERRNRRNQNELSVRWGHAASVRSEAPGQENDSESNPASQRSLRG